MNVRSTAVAVLVAFSGAVVPEFAFAQTPTAPAPPPPAPAPPHAVAPAPAPPPVVVAPPASAASAATVPQTTPSPSPVPAPTPEEMRHRRVVVDIDSTRPSAVVERRVSLTESDGAYFFLPFRSTSSIWEQVCVTPCQVDLDRFSTYRVAGRNGVSPSHSFTLPQSADSLQLKLDAGNLLAHRAGVAVAGAGLAAVIVGIGLIAGKGIFTDENHAKDAGFITGGAGIVLLAVGIPLALLTATNVMSGDTKIGFSPRGFTF